MLERRNLFRNLFVLYVLLRVGCTIILDLKGKSEAGLHLPIMQLMVCTNTVTNIYGLFIQR